MKAMIFGWACLLLLTACGGDEPPNVVIIETLTPAPTSTALPDLEDEDDDKGDAGAVSLVTEAPPPTEPVVEVTRTLEAEETTPTAKPSFQPYLEPSACPFTLPDHPGVVDCGRIIVPENRRGANDGQTISIAVAVFRSISQNKFPDPIFYLEGGPGGKSLDSIQYAYTNLVAPYVSNRDFIIFDQRGVGYSEPALDCPELLELELALLDDDISEEESNRVYLDTLGDCRSRLDGAGVDLASYNSFENAADIEDIRQVLGYDRINLYGISYGTRLALTMMRDYPDAIRSVILDSPVPVQGDLQADIPGHIDGAFRQFFDGCASDRACQAAYPELEDDFYALVERLDARPALFPVTYFFTGDRYNVLFSGEDLINILFQSLYSDEIFPLMPRVIDDAGQENYDLLSQIYANFLINNEFISFGMYYSVNCQEEFAFSNRDRVAAESAAYPGLVDYLDDWPTTFAACDIWDVGVADSIENRPVTSDIPTLIMAGQYDPITPDRWARLVEADLERDTYLLFPAVGHGVTTSDNCAAGIADAFFDDPISAVDLSCAELVAPPRFALPSGAEAGSQVSPQNIVMIPFEADFFGVEFSGLRPESWEPLPEVGGTFLRDSYALDPTFIQHQAFSADLFPDLNTLADTYLSQLADGSPLLIGPRVDATEREWLLYEFEFQQLPAVGGVTEAADGVHFMLVFITFEEAEKESLLDSVLYPALDAVAIRGE